MQNDGIDKLAFTGSTEVGKAIQRELAGRGVRLTLELGGKAANIVFDDCALDQTVEGIVNGIYFNQGHVCCAGSRLLVQESIAEPLVAKLKRRLQTLRVGDPLDKNTDVGAINSRAQLDRIRELVASGVEDGAELYQPPCVLPERGYWFAPTVFTNVAQSSRIAQEEIFGPVLSVLTFRTPAEAVEKANNTPYGLSAGVWTEKGSRILWMAAPPAGRGRVGEHVQPLRPRLAVRRLQGVGLRPRGRPPRARGLPEVRRVTRLPVQKTYKLYIGGAFPRSESGRTYEVDGQNVARASRKDARDAVRAARAAVAKWSGATAYNRGQVLYRLGEMMETRAADLAAACSGAGRGRALDRPGRLVRRLGRQARPGAGRRQPRRRAVLQLHDPRADGRGRDPGPAGAGARGPGVAAPARARRRQHGRRRRRRAPTRWPRSSWPRRSRRATCPPGAVNILTGDPAELAPVLAAPHGRERDRPDGRRPTAPPPSSSGWRPRT